MMAALDNLIDRVTTYRLALYVLLGYVALGAIEAHAGLFTFSLSELLLSTVFLVIMCWAANTLLAQIFNVPANLESATLTALILALILDPPTSIGGLSFLGWVAILAMSSKYILALYNKHLFNPAAIAAVIAAFLMNQSASWWIGTAAMLPGIAIGGWLIVRKTRQDSMVITFLVTAFVVQALASLHQGTPVTTGIHRLLIDSPLIFFAGIMLTEPLTAPPTRRLKALYALIIGVLFIPQVHVGSLYSTPELALVTGNLFSYLVSPKKKLALKLKKKTMLAPDTIDFAFALPQPLAFAPGQYMEWTLGLPHADSRGNRRYFTLASSPTERLLHLGVKFYERGSAFKQALSSLDGQTTVLAGQIAGDFTLPPNPRLKLAFIAGGIGITPFRSMLKYLIDTNQRRDIILIYANRTTADIVYRDVLNDAQRRLGIPVIHTLTDLSAVPDDWTGNVGRADAEMIVREIPDYRDRIFFLSGPPAMVRSNEQALLSLGVRRRQIKKDFFPGLV
ncbi:MAG TPA: FAD-binding oxidoreductase [Nitrolancea sp.]|jgi:ferredoxin-NADP reductase|nr:FAD-binding oxidoreductase [Nitrolancea sp.]